SSKTAIKFDSRGRSFANALYQIIECPSQTLNFTEGNKLLDDKYGFQDTK
ncbi:hypothetical protein A2U01_0100459, partial [Trifolium medium]|nr:hypothetical protein [Trifolium medium]